MPDLALVMQPGADRRRENLPTVSEVAAIVPDARPGIRRHYAQPLDCYPCSSTCDPNFLPLHYILLDLG